MTDTPNPYKDKVRSNVAETRRIVSTGDSRAASTREGRKMLSAYFLETDAIRIRTTAASYNMTIQEFVEHAVLDFEKRKHTSRP